MWPVDESKFKRFEEWEQVWLQRFADKYGGFIETTTADGKRRYDDFERDYDRYRSERQKYIDELKVSDEWRGDPYEVQIRSVLDVADYIDSAIEKLSGVTADSCFQQVFLDLGRDALSNTKFALRQLGLTPPVTLGTDDIDDGKTLQTELCSLRKFVKNRTQVLGEDRRSKVLKDGYCGIKVDQEDRIVFFESRSAHFGRKLMPWKLFLAVWESGDDGISRKDLSDLLWPDRSVIPNTLDQHKSKVDTILRELGVEIATDNRGIWRIAEIRHT